MRKFSLTSVILIIAWLSGCSSLESIKPPAISDINVLKSSENRRTYQADYDTTFRAAVDALRQIDNNSAKLVKYSSGVIVFRKPNETGTITAHVEKLDEQRTRVELAAKNERKFLPDDTDEEARDAFFAKLDEMLNAVPAEISEAGLGEAGQPGSPGVHTETTKADPEQKDLLLAKLIQRLQLADEHDFLDKLSYSDLSVLEERLQALDSVTREKGEVTSKCAACYIDLARIYHDSGQYARSAEALKIAITVEPDNAVAHCNLGEVYKHLQLFDDAIRELNEARRLDPELPDTYINLGIIYDDYVVDDQKALGHYRKYLELGGTDEQVLEWISAIENVS